MSKRYKQRRRQRYYDRQTQCQHLHFVRGRRDQSVRCEYPGIRCRLLDIETGKVSIEYFCSDHAARHGYCVGCGEFWAGVNAFDFDPAGLCPHCRAEVDSESGDNLEEEYDAEFYHLQDIEGGVDFN